MNFLSSVLCLFFASAGVTVSILPVQAQQQVTSPFSQGTGANTQAQISIPTPSQEQAATPVQQPARVAYRTLPNRQRVKRKIRLSQPPRGSATTTVVARALPPIAYVNRPAQPEYLFGQAQVTVKGNEDPVIRLGIAQHGPVVIEFPASDNFFAVHPGGSHLVTYDESPTLSTDHYLVFRAGREFVAPPASSTRKPEAEASISVQMQSGMFVTFLFYPVRDVARMAHRCVVMYSREEVVAARRTVGLAVNLDGKDSQGVLPASISKRVEATTQAANAPTANANQTASQQPAVLSEPTPQVAPLSVTLESGSAPHAVSEVARRRKGKLDIVSVAHDALRASLAAPDKFNQWSQPTHGLELSALAPVDLDKGRRLAVIAIRNVTSAGLRLVAAQPDLEVQTLDERLTPVQVERVMKLHIETTSLAGAIPAGATVYYAIVYQSPVLGAAQRLRVSVAQADAADAPVSAELMKIGEAVANSSSQKRK